MGINSHKHTQTMSTFVKSLLMAATIATASQAMTPYQFLFNGCCRGYPAVGHAKYKGVFTKEKCQQICNSETTCIAIEVNGCLKNSSCTGQCYLFHGAKVAVITNGKCVMTGD